MALRRIFGPKREDVTGDWRKLLIKELHNLFSSLNARGKVVSVLN
jgi:hypothetical protein